MKYNESAYQRYLLGKNLIGCKYSGSGFSWYELTFDFNDDGSIVLNGTPTQIVALPIYYFSDLSGNFILSGCPEGGAVNTYRIDIRYRNGGGIILTSTGGDTYFHAYANMQYAIYIRIEGGYTCNNLIFKPMLRSISIEDDTYSPYSMRLQDLTPIVNNIGIIKNIKFPRDITVDKWFKVCTIENLATDGYWFIRDFYIILPFSHYDTILLYLSVRFDQISMKWNNDTFAQSLVSIESFTRRLYKVNKDPSVQMRVAFKYVSDRIIEFYAHSTDTISNTRTCTVLNRYLETADDGQTNYYKFDLSLLQSTEYTTDEDFDKVIVLYPEDDEPTT